MNRIFSGVQPTGNLHLGNYLGAIRNWVALQESYECIYCIVDLHAVTVPQDPRQLRASTRTVAASLLAAGVDSESSILFNQSQVSAHAELSWVFNCVARLGWLNRMTQFKEKAGSKRDSATVGLYIYPNLMAADILAYKATHVPVGADQKQHLELCRDIAQAFNKQYGTDFFPLPEPLIIGDATRVMSLRDGTSKMSKSDPSDFTRINLTDPPELIVKKIRRARTDAEALPGNLEELQHRPEAANLVGIFAALCREPMETICQRFDGAKFSQFKEELTDLLISELAPIAAEMGRLLDDTGYLDLVLSGGAERAGEITNPIIQEVKEMVGFLMA